MNGDQSSEILGPQKFARYPSKIVAQVVTRQCRTEDGKKMPKDEIWKTGSLA